jgi:hypothetical protein
MNMHSFERVVHITEHAMQRLQERVVTHDGFRNWKQLVKKARYEGEILYGFTDEEYKWYEENISGLFNSSQVRLMNGFAFLFMGNHGHARTLVTVIKVT